MRRQHIGLFANHLLLLIHGRQAKSSRNVRTDPESKIIGSTTACWKDSWWLPQSNDNLSACYRQRFSSPDVERDTLPAPGIHVQLQGDEGFDFRIRRHTVFVLVATKLAANNCLYLQRGTRLQDLNLFVADGFTIGSNGWLHRQVHQDLKQVILNDITDRAGLIIECPPALNAEVFRHRYLYALDLVAVPERLQNCILEA